MATTQFPAGLSGADFYHGNSVTDFHAIAGAGLVFCFLKASEGIDFADPSYEGYRLRAAESGLLAGAYHFFTDTDPIEQARFFIETATPKEGELVPVLDLETLFNGVGEAALNCANEIEALCGHFPIIYSSDSFWQDNLKSVLPEDASLWIARYGRDPVTSYMFWQFSDSGILVGVEGDVDLDVFNGTIEDLQSYVLSA